MKVLINFFKWLPPTPLNPICKNQSY